MELVNKEDFNKQIQSDFLVVDFYATWCGPCKMLSPILETKDFNKLKIDVDSFPEIAQEYRVMSIPTLLIFKNGKLVDKNIGFLSSEELEVISKCKIVFKNNFYKVKDTQNCFSYPKDGYYLKEGENEIKYEGFLTSLNSKKISTSDSMLGKIFGFFFSE